MKSTVLLALSLPVILFGCKSKYTHETGDTDTGYVYHDTGETGDSPIDTEDSVETGDSETAETAETAETGETGDTAIEPTLLALDVYPAAIVVDVGAGWTERAVATQTDGSRADATGVVWSSDDEAIATVDASGTVAGLAVGTTLLHANLGGLDTLVTVEVRDDAILTVNVYDSSTGLPIDQAKVKTDLGTVRSDATGVASALVTDGAPATVTVYTDSTMSIVTYANVTARNVAVYLDPLDWGGADATLHGTVDFTGVADAAWDEVTVGLVAPSMNFPLALMNTDDLFAADRDVTVFGVTVGMPSNLVLEGNAEDYYASTWPGAAGNWGFAGPLKFSDVSDSTGSTEAALSLLITNMPSMTWGYNTGATAVADTQSELDLAPNSAFSDMVTVGLPALSVGFNGDESMLVFAGDDHVDDGWIITGITSGTTSAVISTVPSGSVLDSLGSGVMAYAEVGGIGAGGATSASFGSIASDGSISLPELQDVATIDLWDPSTSSLSTTTDSDAAIVRVRFRDTHHNVHDIYMPSGAWSGALPNGFSGFGKADATVEVTAAQTEDGTYDHWLMAGAIDFREMRVQTTARTVRE